MVEWVACTTWVHLSEMCIFCNFYLFIFKLPNTMFLWGCQTFFVGQNTSRKSSFTSCEFKDNSELKFKRQREHVVTLKGAAKPNTQKDTVFSSSDIFSVFWLYTHCFCKSKQSYAVKTWLLLPSVSCSSAALHPRLTQCKPTYILVIRITKILLGQYQRI